jgi:hypothetical protein
MKKYFWRAWLKPNPFNKDVKNEYVAEVSTVGKTLNNADIARLFVEAGSEYKYETLFGILERADRIRHSKLLEGYSVQTDIAHFSPRILGAWEGSKTFDPAKHKLTLTITPTARMRTGLSSVGVEVLGVRKRGAYIGLVTDVCTGLSDGTLTPGDDIILYGRRIKVLPQDEPGLGIFLTDGTTTYPLGRLAVNYPKEIISRIPPQVPPGTYSLYILTRYTNSIPLREPCRIDYPVPLKIIATSDDEKASLSSDTLKPLSTACLSA